jgi:diguanylate cyclase (GGDEF)-like protein
MSAEVFVEALRRQQPSRHGFPGEAQRYLGVLALAAFAAAGAAIADRPATLPWRNFLVVAIVAAVVQLFAVHTPANQVFHTGLAFTISAAILLPPELVVAVCLIQHLPEWVRQRYPWFIQSFNIVNYTLSSLAAWLAWHTLSGGSGTRDVLAAGAAASAFVLVDHLVLARMLVLARGRTVEQTGLFGVDLLLIDVVLGAIGIAFAFALRDEPALAPVVALPLVLIRRSLVLPTLREQVLKDHKTGLLNMRGIEQAAGEELVRARRFDRPLSILMCDLDGLRRINTRYGHVAGDAALTVIAETFCDELREYDVCGRFGGDEFVVVLPETSLEDAVGVAERVKASLSSREVPHREPFRVGVSIGVAMLGQEASLAELVDRADSAMYAAKERGGNLIRVAA